MASIAAKEIQICIFHSGDLLDYGSIPSWPKPVLAIWDSFAEVIVNLRKRHGANLPVYMYTCPISMSENAAIIGQEGLDPSQLPAAQVYAKYADGTAGSYFLRNTLAQPFIWTAANVKPYVTALLYRSKPSDQTVLCKLFPPLCSVGGWIWFGLAAGATIKAASSDGLKQGLWGTGAALLWKEWYDRGGMEQIKALVSK